MNYGFGSSFNLSGCVLNVRLAHDVRSKEELKIDCPDAGPYPVSSRVARSYHYAESLVRFSSTIIAAKGCGVKVRLFLHHSSGQRVTAFGVRLRSAEGHGRTKRRHFRSS